MNEVLTTMKIDANGEEYEQILGEGFETRRYSEKREHHIDADGSETWMKNGRLHREDGPAMIRDGSKWWYKNGKKHRDNGPAKENADGTKFWYRNGRLIKGCK